MGNQGPRRPDCNNGQHCQQPALFFLCRPTSPPSPALACWSSSRAPSPAAILVSSLTSFLWVSDNSHGNVLCHLPSVRVVGREQQMPRVKVMCHSSAGLEKRPCLPAACDQAGWVWMERALSDSLSSRGCSWPSWSVRGPALGMELCLSLHNSPLRFRIFCPLLL